MKCSSKVTRGFTLIELLAVITVIAILAAILIPVASAGLSRTRTARCASNLREIGNLLSIYAIGNQGKTVTTYDGGINWSVIVGGGTKGNVEALNPTNDIWACPENTLQKYRFEADMAGEEACSYTINGFFHPKSHPDTYDQENRYTSNRLVNFEHPTETYAVFEGTYYRSQVGSGPYSFVRYPHDGAMNVLFADGHVESIQKPDDGDYLTGITAETRRNWYAR